MTDLRWLGQFLARLTATAGFLIAAGGLLLWLLGDGACFGDDEAICEFQNALETTAGVATMVLGVGLFLAGTIAGLVTGKPALPTSTLGHGAEPNLTQ